MTTKVKRCVGCGVEKSWSEFTMRRTPPRPISQCKPCNVRRVQERNRKNPDRYARWCAAMAARKRAPKITALGVPVRCEICGHKFDGVGRWGPQFDHHHGTGAARGWLCNGCNRALGWLGDNPAIIRKAVTYLLEHGFDIKRPRIA